MHNTITLKNIAAELGLSVSTVSKALNDSYEISINTKKKVIDTAKCLKYKPNFFAKNLKRREKLIFGVILPSLKDEFYFNILNGITEESYKKGHLIMFYQTGNNLEREIKYTKLLSEDIIDGLIYSSIYKRKENKYLKKILEDNFLPVQVIEKNKLKKDIDLGRKVVNKIITKINY